MQELEKEVTLLQQEIASLKEESTPGLKTAALTQPESNPGSFNPAPAADDAPAKVSIATLLGPVTLSGFGDFYYGYDNNHPFNNQAGLRSFEAPTNSFNFNMAELILDKVADTTSAENRVGYHVSAGYGYAARVIDGSDVTGFSSAPTPSTPSLGSNFFVKEAYVSYIFPFGKGLTVTVGKFVTPMGAEVIESNANWNYSRGLLFDYAIPLFHFGANAKYVFNPKWAVTGYLVNGWNNTIINHDCLDNNNSCPAGQSSGLTYGGSVVYTPNMKWSATENYFAGPVTGYFMDSGATANFWKQISDTVIAYTPNMKWAFQVNGDYGFVQDSSPDNFTWWGVAGYAKYTWTPKTNFVVRYEYYGDPEAFTGLLPDPDGDGSFKKGHAQEVTGTYSYNLTSALLIRGEYRYDFASYPIFLQSFSAPSNSDACYFKCVKEQNTATISFVYTFSSANLK